MTSALLLAPPTLLTEDTDAVDATPPLVPLVLLALEALVCAEAVVGPLTLVTLSVADMDPVPLVVSEFSVLEHAMCESTSVGKAKSLLRFM